jgi:mono/diheme cytochrome c family protein
MKSRRLRATKFAVSALCILMAARAMTLTGTASASDQIDKDVLPPTEENLAAGMNHFEAHCAACHGADGKAATEKGRQLHAADLTSKTVQSKPDRDLFNVIERGVPGTGMPSFGGTHTQEEIRQIVLFLRRLPNLTAEARARLRNAMPAEGHHHEMRDKSESANAPEGGDHHHDETEPAAEHQHDMTAHDMSPHDMSAMMSTLTGGPFKAMQAIGSGTSLSPANSPMNMWHWTADAWTIMSHANVLIGFNHQGGPRGVNKAESSNWLMVMAERKAGPGQLMLRSMFSAEPFTSPNGGFPELFQTGETYKGKPIIDAQHPHDLFMELAAAYTIQASEHVAINLYAGPIGEPALGPVAFMHRASASENPAAPLGHHWQDSTHISYGVVTAGITAWRLRIEGSVFHGAEPDENRYNIEAGKLDSWSGRIWLTPTRDWSMQFSYGHLVHPEKLEPGNVKRMTASISHNRSWKDGNWASSLVWGRNHERSGNSNAYLLESTANFLDRNYVYTRMELVDKPGLLEENIFGRQGAEQFQIVNGEPEPGPLFDRFFRVGAFTIGGVRDLVAASSWRLGIGADVTFYHVPDALKPIYDSNPASFHFFLRFRPGRMSQ